MIYDLLRRSYESTVAQAIGRPLVSFCVADALRRDRRPLQPSKSGHPTLVWPRVRLPNDRGGGGGGARALRSGWVMQGPEVAAFEGIRSFVSAAHACAVSSGTAALHLALLAVAVGSGDEVVTVSHSYVRMANAAKVAARLSAEGISTRSGISNAHASYAAMQHLPKSEAATSTSPQWF